MQYVNLGSTGLMVSRLALGCMTYGSNKWRGWVLNEEESRPFIQRAWELGINFFDTADMYSDGASEEVLGRALKSMGVRREEVVIATKLFYPMGKSPNEKGLGRKHIRHAIDASLRRLGTDYVDLYQIHRLDKHTPIEEIMEALGDVVRAGKALYLGASSMPAYHFIEMQHAAERSGGPRFVAMQNHYNILYREEEREMIPLCRSEGIGILPWSPLARGRLARPWQSMCTKRLETDQFGKKMYSQTEEMDQKVVERLGQVAEKRGVPHAQVALAWLLSKPGVTSPIVGASKPNHLKDAVAALSLRLGAEEISSLEELYAPHPVLGFS